MHLLLGRQRISARALSYADGGTALSRCPTRTAPTSRNCLCVAASLRRFGQLLQRILRCAAGSRQGKPRCTMQRCVRQKRAAARCCDCCHQKRARRAYKSDSKTIARIQSEHYCTQSRNTEIRGSCCRTEFTCFVTIQIRGTAAHQFLIHNLNILCRFRT